MEVADEALIVTDRLEKVSFFSLFCFATWLDYGLMVIGTLSAMGMGVLQPLLFFFMATFFNSFNSSSSLDDFYESVVKIVYYLIIFGVVFLILGWIGVMSFVVVGARQGGVFREK